MKRIILLLGILSLCGCATWNDMSTGQKTAVVVGAVVVVGVVAAGSYSSSDSCEVNCEY